MARYVCTSFLSIVVILGFAFFGQGGASASRAAHSAGTLVAAAGATLSEYTAAQETCTCSCGVACDGTCIVDYVAGQCSIPLGAACVLNCCRNAPAPSKEDCLDDGF